jgi:spermidine/putrescine-binding protein
MAADGAWIAYGYSGDVFQMHDLNEAVEYRLPAFGALQFVDNLVIPAQAPHRELAHAFIEYILDPKTSADITTATNYGNPNTAALVFIDEELKSNPSVFLPKQSTTKLHFIKDIGDDISLYDDAWQQIKR